MNSRNETRARNVVFFCRLHPWVLHVKARVCIIVGLRIIETKARMTQLFEANYDNIFLDRIKSFLFILLQVIS